MYLPARSTEMEGRAGGIAIEYGRKNLSRLSARDMKPDGARSIEIGIARNCQGKKEQKPWHFATRAGRAGAIRENLCVVAVSERTAQVTKSGALARHHAAEG
jgi:hypothetical protein